LTATQDCGLEGNVAIAIQSQIADRFVFLLKHRSQFVGAGQLHKSPRETVAPQSPAPSKKCIWLLLLLALPRPARLQMDFSCAFQLVDAKLSEAEGELGEFAQVRALVAQLQRDHRERIRFYDTMEELGRTRVAHRHLSALRAMLVAHGKAQLAEEVPHSFVSAISFHNLCAFEAAWLANSEDEDFATVRVRQAGTQREPWVESPARDYFGVALSGGGIRSATFNLGVLQGLAELRVLDDVDYVATVSGGGYIGGFWTAFRHANNQETFPRAGVGSHDRREHAAIRHLREFSRFLVPRVGFAQYETWNAIVVTVGGTLASLTAMAAAIAFALYVWQFAAHWLAEVSVTVGALTFGSTTGAGLLLMQYRLWHVGTNDSHEKTSAWPKALPSLAGAATAAAWWSLYASGKRDPNGATDLGIPCVFAPAAAWGICCLALYVFRGASARWSTLRFSTVLDRTIGQLLALTALVGSLGLVWLLADWLRHGPVYKISALGTLGAASAALFVWLGDWLKAPIQATRGSALTTRLLRVLKPFLPQVAANAAAAMMITGVAVFVQHNGFGSSSPDYQRAGAGFVISGLLVLAALVLFDPARTGLHDFYRARISRCFLGAAHAKTDESCLPRPRAVTVERAEDDITFGELRKRRSSDSYPPGPIHLVCCAANNLSGDVLGNLYRGARSAVLSPFGIAVGSVAAPLDKLKLSAALTASAAAFNSQMGSISIDLGPAVAFVMCALNLRLGLWVPHPANPKAHQSVAPGWHFFLEALGLSRSDQITSPGFLDSRSSLQARATSYLDRYGSKLHLSDGGHFENLGVYELIRRHCRYVIVSDASADPNLCFDDLGNAIRRVREDFGVEIELDVSPLQKCEDGFSQRHAVIGTIHYDGLSGTDKGILIYFKPALTGDEPVDVLEHRRRSPHFPHDGTGDQFYDEAQWESYRRLGQHATSSVLRAPLSEAASERVDRLFTLAHQRWHPAPRDSDKISLALVERSKSFEAAVRDHAPAFLRAEFFPEVATALRRERADAKGSDGSHLSSKADADEVTRAVYFVMHAAQLMEDVWLAANLESNATHPLNKGWMSYFHRWAGTPSFRTWWPVLRPLYSPGFRNFVKERFDLHLGDKSSEEGDGWARLELRTTCYSTVRDAVGGDWARYSASSDDQTQVLAYEMTLPSRATRQLSALLVGSLLYRAVENRICWKSSHLFVHPTLMGAGIMYRFLKDIVAHFANRELCVTIETIESEGTRRQLPPLSSQSGLELISFYRSHGFRRVSQPKLSPGRQGPVQSEVWVRRPQRERAEAP